VLFTGIVDSTQRASRLGDRRWRALLNVHDQLAWRLVEDFGGQLIKTTGDGILATFDGPAGRSAARRPSQLSWRASASSSGRGRTPARSSCATATSAASPCTSRPG
jgi:class 3 adenylate cyclase